MKFEKAAITDVNELTELRIAYIKEDLGVITNEQLVAMKELLPDYFNRHLNEDLYVYIARENDEIVSCAFLLIVEKPMSPAFFTGKTGTVLNVYTKPEYRYKGCAKQLMKMMMGDAAADDISPIELKSTDDGYKLYKSVGFEDVVSKYHTMRFCIK